MIGLTQYAVRGDGREYMAMAQALTQGRLIGTHFPLYPAVILSASLVMKTEVAALAIPPIFHVLFAFAIYVAGKISPTRYLLFVLWTMLITCPFWTTAAHCTGGCHRSQQIQLSRRFVGCLERVGGHVACLAQQTPLL